MSNYPSPESWFKVDGYTAKSADSQIWVTWYDRATEQSRGIAIPRSELAGIKKLLNELPAQFGDVNG